MLSGIWMGLYKNFDLYFLYDIMIVFAFVNFLGRKQNRVRRF
ncbi:hypothetical protein SPONN_2229 [uncultured Candidatus Thioglobus sp.]|nr:hypothetical protein SPONN_2229 [uncultured Candidatus Thioglobus sp.]